MGGAEIERLIALLAKIPGLGPRSARRAALRMLQQPGAKMLPLAAALAEAARAVRPCSACGNLDTQNPCSICADRTRDRSLICVVETVGDLWALERAGVFRGLYHVLGGALSALSGIGPEDLNAVSLLSRVTDSGVTEVILALSATVDGAATMHWLAERLKPLGVTVTRVAQGVPIGGALDILDEGTLATALRARRPA
ncbi:MAG: recombination protein RecR [Acetobacteraceae bacterium]|nr:recombination protein RecR [Acetobacteraceae bacterium]MBV8522591.1 recombination protein RecR [Acetobacteraceae bacterium]